MWKRRSNPGIFNGFFKKSISKDPIVKNFLRNLNKQKFVSLINYMKLKIKKNKNKETKASLQFLNSLITLVDEDLILTIKDRVLSPLYYQYDFPEVVRLMKKNKFKKLKSLYLSSLQKFKKHCFILL